VRICVLACVVSITWSWLVISLRRWLQDHASSIRIGTLTVPAAYSDRVASHLKENARKYASASHGVEFFLAGSQKNMRDKELAGIELRHQTNAAFFWTKRCAPRRLFMKLQAGWLLVGVAILLGIVLRFAWINSDNLSGDETASLTFSSGHQPHGEWELGTAHKTHFYRTFTALDPNYFSQRLFSMLRKEVHPPLYYFILTLWMHLFGNSEASLRSLSLLASVGSIPLLYILGRNLLSAEVGIYAAFLFSFAPFQIAYAQEARPYSLLVFFALLSTLFAVKLWRGAKEWRWLFAYATAALFGLYLHYFFIWNVLFHWILVTFSQRRNRGFLFRWGVMQMFVVGIFLLWAPTLFEQVRWGSESGARGSYGNLPWPDIVLYTGRDVALFLSAGRVEGFCSLVTAGERCGLDVVATAILYGIPILLVGASAWRLFLYCGKKSGEKNPATDTLSLCVLWGLCIFGGTIVLDMIGDSHAIKLPRYLISASIPLYLAIATVFASVNNQRLRIGVVCTVLLFLLVGSGAYHLGLARTIRYEQGFREAARYLDRHVASDDLVLVSLPERLIELAYYLKSDLNLAGIVPSTERWNNRGDIQAAIKKLMERHEVVWFLDEHVNSSPSQRHDLFWLRTHYREVEVKEFKNLNLFVFRSTNGMR
jgi:mannosyltransferase